MAFILRVKTLRHREDEVLAFKVMKTRMMEQGSEHRPPVPAADALNHGSREGTRTLSLAHVQAPFFTCGLKTHYFAHSPLDKPLFCITSGFQIHAIKNLASPNLLGLTLYSY